MHHRVRSFRAWADCYDGEVFYEEIFQTGIVPQTYPGVNILLPVPRRRFKTGRHQIPHQLTASLAWVDQNAADASPRLVVKKMV